LKSLHSLCFIQNIKAAREMRTSQKIKGEAPEERDFDVRELREMNKQGQRMIGEVVHQYPEISQAVHLYFTQVSLSKKASIHHIVVLCKLLPGCHGP
jgi:hypothetical protein